MTRDEIEKEFEKIYDSAAAGSATGEVVVERVKLTLVKFAEHILRVAEQKRWCPIETAPKDTAIQLWCGWLMNRIGHYNTRDDLNCFVDDNLVRFGTQPTHWQPLSIAPEQARSGKMTLMVDGNPIGVGNGHFVFKSSFSESDIASLNEVKAGSITFTMSENDAKKFKELCDSLRIDTQVKS